MKLEHLFRNQIFQGNEIRSTKIELSRTEKTIKIGDCI